MLAVTMKPKKQREWDAKPDASSFSYAFGYRHTHTAVLLAQEPICMEERSYTQDERCLDFHKFSLMGCWESQMQWEDNDTEIRLAPLRG